MSAIHASGGGKKLLSQKTFCTVIGMLGRLYKEDGTRKKKIPEDFEKRIKERFRLYMKSGIDLRAMIDYLRLSFLGQTTK